MHPFSTSLLQIALINIILSNLLMLCFFQLVVLFLSIFIILCIIQPLPYPSLRSYTWESQQSYSSPSGVLVIGLIRSCTALHNPTCMAMLGYVPHLYYLFEDYVLASSSFGVWDFSLLFFVELLSLFLPRLILFQSQHASFSPNINDRTHYTHQSGFLGVGTHLPVSWVQYH